MERHCSISNQSKAFHLRFDRNFHYFSVKWDWKREFLKMERQVSVGPDRPVKEHHFWRWTAFSGNFHQDRSVPFMFRPKFPEILAQWKAPCMTAMAQFSFISWRKMSSSGLHSVSQNKEVKLNLFIPISWYRSTSVAIHSQQMDKEITNYKSRVSWRKKNLSHTIDQSVHAFADYTNNSNLRPVSRWRIEILFFFVASSQQPNFRPCYAYYLHLDSSLFCSSVTASRVVLTKRVILNGMTQTLLVGLEWTQSWK